jgi:hypothetical protein
VDAPQKMAFVIQSNRLQGLIWQALLKSQNIAVILEPSRTDLEDCISQIAAAGLTLPDVIILDAEIDTLNPYEFCRWCHNAFPQISIFLTRLHRHPVIDTEKRWAMHQGATGFFNGFHRDTLMINAVESMKLILHALDSPFLNEKALLAVLLNIRRQLSALPAATLPSAPSGLANGQGRTYPGRAPLKGFVKVNGKSVNGNGQTSGKGENGNGARGKEPGVRGQPTPQGTASPDILNDISWVSSGLRALTPQNDQGKSLPRNLFSEAPAAPPAVQSNEIPKASDPDPQDNLPKVRRYRGVVY